MSTAPENTNPDPEPFFVDPRSLREKLAAKEVEWRPTDPQNGCPPMIWGLLLERGTFLSTLGSEPEHKPTLRILEWPANLEWKVIAFHGWLKREIETKDPQPSDFVVASYTGVKKATKAGYSDGNMYRLFVEHNPAGRVAPVSPEPEQTEDGGEHPFDDHPGVDGGVLDNDGWAEES